MTIQTVQSDITIDWDDSVVMVFSFDTPGGRMACGFVHQVLSVQSQSGNQTQVSAILQLVQQVGIQVSLDPQTWVETVKNAARSDPATIVFDDTESVIYTTQTNQSFTLQSLFSVHG